MNYIYNDEDNSPMMDENFQQDGRDCRNCKHRINDECELWDCKFEPREGS